MSLSPLLNVPVLRQDSTVEVVAKGDGSHETDEVLVTTTLTLAGDIDPNQDVTILLPMATDAQQRPLLRWMEDDVATGSVPFDPVERSTYDQAVADALQDVQEAQRQAQQDLATAIANAASGFSQAVIKVKPGQRTLRFFYSLAASKTGEREYEFRVLGPLATFVLQPGGQIGLVAILPRNTTVVSAVALRDPNDPSSEVPKVEHDLGGRHVIGWDFQLDPLYTVRYRY